MEGFDLLEVEQWSLEWLGLEHSFFTINSKTITDTWLVLGFIVLGSIFARSVLAHKTGVARFLVLSLVQAIKKLFVQTVGFFSFKHFCFIGSLLLFILLCNAISIFPWLEEPTKDLNTTLALGIIAFGYIQYYAVRTQGASTYFKEYFQPFFFMLPLNVIGKVATVVSLSFRLFGNIFGGATIAHFYLNTIQGSFIFETLGLISGVNFVMTIFFGLFEGFLQAFVFSMLTLTYLSIELQSEPGEPA